MVLLFSERMLLSTSMTGRLLRSTVISSRSTASSSKHMQQATTVAIDDSQLAEGVESSTVRPTSEIPSPKSYPFLGNILALTFHKDFDKKYIQNVFKSFARDYGPVVKFTIPALPPLVILTNPDDCEKVTRATMENPIRNGFLSLDKVRRTSLDNYFEGNLGLLVENEENWKKVRSRVQTPMMKAKYVNAYLTQMDDVTLDFMDRIAYLQEEHGEMPSDFQFELYKWALESVSLVALNRRMGCLDPNISSDSVPMKIIHNVNRIFDYLNETEHGLPLWRIYPTKAFRKLQQTHHEFLTLADESIRETEAALLEKADTTDQENLTLMETLLLTPGLSRKDVVTLILDMLIAGIDTTSHTLGFTLYLLARNPKCQAKLQEEVDSILGDHQGPITSKHLARLSYLKAVIKESFRIFPITIGTARTLEKDLVLSGYLVPKGHAALLMGLVMGHDEKNFPRADEFIPERWLRHKPLGPIHPYATLPFGVGTRMCIGRRIAEQEMYTFLVRVMQRFTVDYKYEDMKSISRLVYCPSEPLQFTFSERK